MESIEVHVSALENNSDHYTGNLDVLRADLHAVQNRQLTENKTGNSALQKCLEYLENKERIKNIKILNLPTNVWETNE